MQNSFKKLAELSSNIKKVLALAYEIDKELIIKYYVTAFIGAVAPVVAGFIFKFFIDQLVNQGQLSNQPRLPVLVVLIFAAYMFVTLVETVVYWGMNVSYYDYLLRNRLQSGLMYRFSKKLGSLDLEHLENPEIQNLITKVRDSYQWQIPDFVRTWNYVFSNIIGILSACIALVSFGWWIPLLVVLVCIPRFYLKVRHGIFVWSMYGSGAPQVKKLWYQGWLLTEEESILETRIFQSQQALLDKMASTQEDLYKLNKRPLDNYRWVIVLAPLIESLVVIGIIYFLIPSVFIGALSVGTLTFIVTTLMGLKNNAAWGAAHFGELYEKNLFIKPYFELMNLPKLVKEKVMPHVFEKIKPPLIEFKDVSFAYPNGREVLKNISFTIKPGESVALVGSNGAGKTTIIKLLCRFYDVTEGEILINGVNIKDLKFSNWYSHLGTLFQNFVKYQFTVRENITLGNPGVRDEKRMVDAAKKSGAYDFIKELPKEFDQVLGRSFEDGDEISGGQWQKLAIARAFYQEAPVLIMDEPTSAIDAEAEYEIFNNLEKSYKDKTLILVSHRFSTVRNANKILVIDEGKVVEQGTHMQLIEKDGKYARMFNIQAKGYQ